MTEQMPFDVPWHEMMVLRVPGKMPLTVLTIERMLYSWRLCEYSEPLYIARSWWYESQDEAITALATFLSSPGNEPQDWIRADGVVDGHYCIRRAHIVDGERVITVDEPE